MKLRIRTQDILAIEGFEESKLFDPLNVLKHRDAIQNVRDILRAGKRIALFAMHKRLWQLLVWDRLKP